MKTQGRRHRQHGDPPREATEERLLLKPPSQAPFIAAAHFTMMRLALVSLAASCAHASTMSVNASAIDYEAVLQALWDQTDMDQTGAR